METVSFPFYSRISSSGLRFRGSGVPGAFFGRFRRGSRDDRRVDVFQQRRRDQELTDAGATRRERAAVGGVAHRLGGGVLADLGRGEQEKHG